MVLVVVRPEVGERATPPRIELSPELGVVGDRWSRREHPVLDAQVTIMRAAFNGVFADGQPLALAGDNILVDLDVSAENLPPGTRLRVGTALCEVTPKPHRGCDKFTASFGKDACEVTRDEAFADRRFRGLHVRVVEGGHVSPADTVRVVSRGQAALSG